MTPDSPKPVRAEASGVAQGGQCVSISLNNGTTSANYVDQQHNQRDYQQNVNEPTNGVTANYAQQPQDQQYYKDCPKHLFSSLLSVTPGYKTFEYHSSNDHASRRIYRGTRKEVRVRDEFSGTTDVHTSGVSLLVSASPAYENMPVLSLAMRFSSSR